uniref:Uncharacterized protein n=1 Tax=Theileria annulata TaxID=5874 RepID=A0A3B0ML53_THEAN
MYIIYSYYSPFAFFLVNLFFCKCLHLNNIFGPSNKFKDRNFNLLFLNRTKKISQIYNLIEFQKCTLPSEQKKLVSGLNLFDNDPENIDDAVTRILYGLNDPKEIGRTYINSEGKIINKKKHLYSIGELCHVDDFFEGKFRVEWTVRGVKEKLQYRYRDSHTLPLTTSRFSLAGIKGFVLRLWLDGHKGSKKGFVIFKLIYFRHIAMSLVQQEHWSTLDSPICLFAGKIVKGPFFYRSPEYIQTFQCSKSFCPLEDVVENNTIKLGVMIAKRENNSRSS